MSNWSEIDKEIIKLTENPVCFFEDDFQLSSKVKHLDHLPDTKEYIQCLEKKLEKLKGSSSSKTTSSKSKDIIQSLINVRQDTMCNLLKDGDLLSTDNLDELNDNLNESSSTVSNNYLDKKINPEKQALTKEELQLLIKADYLAIRTESSTNQNE